MRNAALRGTVLVICLWLAVPAGGAPAQHETAQAASWLGDLDGDGQPTVADAIRILRIAVGLDPYNPRADVDCNGTVDITDAIKILRCAVGLDPWPIIPSPPPGPW